MKQVQTFLDGKKTHLVAFVTVLYGLYEGYVASGGSYKTFVPYLLGGAGLSALRLAISKKA